MDTKKCIKLDEATLREYDGLVGLTMLNIYSLSKEKGIIRLQRFDRKRKDHLFVLRVALMARDIYQFPIEVDAIDEWWGRFCLNRKLRKHFDKVSKAPDYSADGVWVTKLLEFMKPDGVARLGENFSFADIYDAYYEGSCN